MNVRYRWCFPKSICVRKGIDETAQNLVATFANLFKENCKDIKVVFNPKSLEYEMYVTIDEGENENGGN